MLLLTLLLLLKAQVTPFVTLFSLKMKQKCKSLNISASERPTAKLNPFLESLSNARFCCQ